MARKGLDGPRSTFGKLFYERYGETCTTNRKLYDREQRYFIRTGHLSVDENGNEVPKWVNRGRKPGTKDSYKRERTCPAPELRPTSEFGNAFFEHYGLTKKDNRNLYSKEIKYFMKTGHVSWDENITPKPARLGLPVGVKDSYKLTINKKEQNTMTIKDYANQLKTKFDSVSANWNKLTIEQLEHIENCLNLVVKPVVVPPPAPIKKRTRKFNGFSAEVLKQKEEFKQAVANGYTGKYREWLKLKKASGVIYTNKL